MTSGAPASELPDPAGISPIRDASWYAGGPVLWQTASLRYGGVNRQVMANACVFQDFGIPLSLLCDDMGPEEGRDFNLPLARGLFTEIVVLTKQLGDRSLYAAALEYCRRFPALPDIKRQVLAIYMAFFLHIRPRVAQIWNGDHVLPALAAVLAGVPHVLSCARSQPPNQRAPYGYESTNPESAYDAFHFMLNFPSFALAANSIPGCRGYERWLGMPEGSVIHTPNAFSPQEWPEPSQKAVAALRHRIGLPEGAPLISGVMRFATIKDPLLWLECVGAALAAMPDAHAALFGDGEMEQFILSALKRLPARERIHVFPPVRDAGIVYAASSAFLLTSHIEGLPNVLLEAAYHRVPVVTTPAGGAPEAVKDGVSGFVVGSREPRRIADKLLYILDNPDWARKAGEAGRALVTGKFSPRKTARVFADLYADWE